MKPNELRLGLLFDNHGAICQVISISKNSAEFGYFEDSIGFERRFDEIVLPNPIPLTEEWLLKFGILKWFLNNTFEIRNNETYYSVYAWKSGGAIFICDLKYVHQIQNLYFALTGEELNIKQPA